MFRKARPVSCWAQMGRVEPSVLRRSGPLKQSKYERRTPLMLWGLVSSDSCCSSRMVFLTIAYSTSTS